jgi:putative ABC transport system permease protein
LGVLTALRATTGDVRNALAEGGRRQGTALRTPRTGRLIVAGQIAITLTLLVGAGLLGRSMLRALSIHPGFETDHVATLDLKLPELEESAETKRIQFLEQLISQAKLVPGVQSVGGTNAIPLDSDPADGTFAIVNPQQLTEAQKNLIDRSAHISAEKSDPSFPREFTSFLHDLYRDHANTGYADFVIASDGYFQTLGIPLLNGRLFNDGDGPTTPHVAVISDSLAQQKWPGENPIGHTIEFGSMDGDLRLLTIIGVAGDVRTHSLEIAPRPTVYVNYRQRPRNTSQFNLVLWTNSDPAGVFSAVRRVLSQLDPTVPPRFNTFDQIFSESLNSRRFNLMLVGVFAIAALLLAMAGVFGVLAYSVAQRTRELGVRIALGATKGNVLKMVLKQALVTATIGIVLGLVGSFLLTRTMRSLLFEVSPTDPVIIVGVVLLIVFIALLASFIPARRATRVDPMVALRSE